MFKKIRHNLKPALPAVMAALAAAVIVLAWNEPLQNPPLGNVSTPLNTTTTPQLKQGNLAVNTENIGINGFLVPYGRVGIGTPNPAYKLDVQDGQINASGGLCMAGTCKTAWDTVTNYWTASGNNIYNNNSGNVGIGTASPPGAKLEVAGQVKITGGSPGAGKVLVSDASGLASWSSSPMSGVLRGYVLGPDCGVTASCPSMIYAPMTCTVSGPHYGDCINILSGFSDHYDYAYSCPGGGWPVTVSWNTLGAPWVRACYYP